MESIEEVLAEELEDLNMENLDTLLDLEADLCADCGCHLSPTDSGDVCSDCNI